MPEVPPTATPVIVEAMTLALFNAWKRELGTEPTIDQLGVLMAQWHLETGGGASMIQYNVGNFKRPHPSASDLYTCFTTYEVVNGHRTLIVPPDPGCQFAAWASLDDGAQAYLHAMINHFGRAWQFVIRGDIDGFAQCLYSIGYFTASPIDYEKGMHARLALILPAMTKALMGAASTQPPTAASVADTQPAMALPDVTPDAPNTDDDPNKS